MAEHVVLGQRDRPQLLHGLAHSGRRRRPHEPRELVEVPDPGLHQQRHDQAVRSRPQLLHRRRGRATAGPAQAAPQTITNGTQFTNTSGNPLHAHGGGVLKVGSYYYWFGENRNADNTFRYVSAYRSTDLKNWQFRNHVLTEATDPELETANIERPKVMYNAATGKWSRSSPRPWRGPTAPQSGRDTARLSAPLLLVDRGVGHHDQGERSGSTSRTDGGSGPAAPRRCRGGNR